jgi:hypothetical protein
MPFLCRGFTDSLGNFSFIFDATNVNHIRIRAIKTGFLDEEEINGTNKHFDIDSTLFGTTIPVDMALFQKAKLDLNIKIAKQNKEAYLSIRVEHGKSNCLHGYSYPNLSKDTTISYETNGNTFVRIEGKYTYKGKNTSIIDSVFIKPNETGKYTLKF